jgi:hypothetical protein
MRRGKLLACVAAALLASASATAVAWTLDWQDWQMVGFLEYQLTNSGVSERALALYGNSGLGVDYGTLVPSWRYQGIQGITGAANARLTLGVSIHDVSTTSCDSAITATLTLNRFSPANTSEGSMCGSGSSLGSFFVSRSWNTCGNGVADYFSTSWFGTTSNNPIRVAHSQAGTPSAGDNYYMYQAKISDSAGRVRADLGCYKTYYY